MKLCTAILFGSVALAEPNLSSVNQFTLSDLKINQNNISNGDDFEQVSNNSKINETLAIESDPEIPQNISKIEEVEIEAQPIGLNNIDNDDQGNWILKKLWWQEGQNIYTDIIKINDDLLSLQLSFLVLKNDMEKQFLQQWQSLNIDEENLTGKFNDFKAKILQAKEKQTESNENEQQKNTQLDNAANALDGLKKDLQDIYNNQNQADEGFKQVSNNIKQCRNFETDSWRILQKIAKTLDDLKAKEYYQKIFVNYQNAKNLASFLKDEYYFYVKKLAEEQLLLFKSIKDKLQILASSGYRFDKADLASTAAKQPAAKTNDDENIERKKNQQAKIAKANANKSFLNKLYTKLNNWFSNIF
jgi:hypothetical protein